MILDLLAVAWALRLPIGFIAGVCACLVWMESMKGTSRE